MKAGRHHRLNPTSAFRHGRLYQVARRKITPPEGAVTDSLFTPDKVSKDFKLTVTLPQMALTAIDTKGKWTGKAVVSVIGPTADRIGKIASLAAAKAVQRRYTPAPEVTWLIEEWNRRVSPPPYNPRDRNKQFALGDLETYEWNILHLFDMLSREEIVKLLDQYFNCCAKDEHIWNGIDHRCSSLGTWVNRVEKSRSLRLICWWEPKSKKRRQQDYTTSDDENPELTALIAENYAQLVLDRETYGPPDYHWNTFARLAVRINKMVAASQVTVQTGIIVKAVIRAAQVWQESFSGARVYPNHLLAKTLWTVELPQFLKGHLPGVRVPPDILSD